MSDLTYILTSEANIMLFLFLGIRRGLEVSLNIHFNYLLVLPLREEGSNKLQGSGYFWI